MKSNPQASFSKKHTATAKGILIIMMLIHHVFYPDAINEHDIQTILTDQSRITQIVLFCKICIAGFAFLSAYGITHSFRNAENDDHGTLFSLTARRFIKLELSVAFIYVLAILFKHFVMHQSIHEAYSLNPNDVLPLLTYMVIDILGMASYANTPTINVTWWYLSYAILLIAAMPIIYKAYEKFRYLLLPAICLPPYAIMLPGVSFSELLPIAILGTAFAYEDWFEKLGNITKLGKIQGIGIKICKLIISFSMIYAAYLLRNYVGSSFSYPFAFVIPYIVYEFISCIPLLREFLGILGKYATTMFLTHTFIYRYFYEDFIYSFRKSWLILLVLLGTSLGVAILIELLKKLSGYNRLVSRILSIQKGISHNV